MGESKLCQRIELAFELVLRTRLPVSLRLNCTEVEVVVAAVQTVFLPASVNMSSPPFCNKSFDPFPLTGWSRLAVQTTVRSNDLANHTAKMNALSPTG